MGRPRPCGRATATGPATAPITTISRIARLRQLHGTRVFPAGSGDCTPYPARRGTFPRACPPTIRALLRGRTAGCSRPDGYGEALDVAGPTGAQWRQSEAPHIMNHVLHGLAPL